MSGKTDIEDKIGQLLKNNAATVPNTIIDHELLKNLSQDASEKKQTTTSQDSFKKLWKAINEIKSIISPAHATKAVDSDTEKVKKNVICTGVNTKESLMTNYFKSYDKAKHQHILQLEAKCNKLENEKWELTKQVAQLKWIENTQKTNHQNTETNGKHRAKEQPKRNKVKKKKKRNKLSLHRHCRAMKLINQHNSSNSKTSVNKIKVIQIDNSKNKANNMKKTMGLITVVLRSMNK